MFISKPSFDGLIDSSVLVRQHADRLEAAELERRNREFETKVRETLAKLPTSSSDCVTRWTIDATGVEGSYLMRIAGRIKILGYEVQMHDSSMVVKLPTEKAEKVTGESWSPAREHQDVIERVALGRFSDLAASLQTYFLESPRGTYKTSFNLLSPADQVCWKWLRELLGGQGYSVRESDFRIITSSDVPENMGMIGNITF
ncbi:MAG: hypothetical protein KDK78_00615, partial [Chlamydiia bacterium]|nr:hypothetical protein [Chlamydiia bacterium]